MNSLILWADGYVIELYRITGNPIVDYLIGTFLLAVISVLIGEATLSLLKSVNKRHIEHLDDELAQKYELSMKSRHSGDEESYRCMNRQANEAFGKVFFNMFTFSAASLWAVFFVMAWMQTRFIDIEFFVPGFEVSFGYVFTFFLLYIVARILIRNIKLLCARRSALDRQLLKLLYEPARISRRNKPLRFL